MVAFWEMRLSKLKIESNLKPQPALYTIILIIIKHLVYVNHLRSDKTMFSYIATYIRVWYYAYSGR